MNLRTFCAGAVLLSLGCQSQPPSEPIETAAVDPLERGQYLVTVLACGDCHTPFQGVSMIATSMACSLK